MKVSKNCKFSTWNLTTVPNKNKHFTELQNNIQKTASGYRRLCDITYGHRMVLQFLRCRNKDGQNLLRFVYILLINIFE